MSKTYFFLIGILVVLVLIVGGFAFYKSSIAPSRSAPTATSPQPTVSPQRNQIMLAIISPKNGAQLSVSSVQITGKTVPGADVSINDQELKADAAGNFTATVALEKGDNYFAITAVDASGQVAEQELVITYTPTQ